MSSILRLGSLYVVGNYLSAEQGYLASGIVSLSGMAFIFRRGNIEGGKSNGNTMEKLRNPLSSLTFFAIERFNQYGIFMCIPSNTRLQYDIRYIS